jgi:putative ABC transport system ATP-binding protein
MAITDIPQIETETIIRTENLYKTYHTGDIDVHAVNNIAMTIPRGKMTAIVGRSGAGKTTLLNLLSGLDEPTDGKVFIDEQDLYALSEEERLMLRRDRIGFVFQNFGLLPLLSAEENVSIPLRMQKLNRQHRDHRVHEALEWVGLRARAKHRPYELSGGEQQRVAIARALAAQPELIMADEPTGQLDSQTGKRILAIMRELVQNQGITMVIVTHDLQVQDAADVVYLLKDGVLTTTRQSVDTDQ